MSNNGRTVRHWISAWWPVALSIAVISISSSTWFASEHTSGPFRAIYQALFGQVSDARWDVVHFYMRKAGHFTGYGLIGLAWLRAWWMSLPHSRFLQDATLALLGCALMASADEYHQTFLPDRTGSPWDVLLDCCGALTLQLIVYIVMRVGRPKRLMRAA
jgi:VanZ family protein